MWEGGNVVVFVKEKETVNPLLTNFLKVADQLDFTLSPLLLSLPQIHTHSQYSYRSRICALPWFTLLSTKQAPSPFFLPLPPSWPGLYPLHNRQGAWTQQNWGRRWAEKGIKSVLQLELEGQVEVREQRCGKVSVMLCYDLYLEQLSEHKDNMLFFYNNLMRKKWYDRLLFIYM